MYNYIQLKDGIAFSYITTPSEIEESSNIIKVDDNSENLVGMKYNNGSFIEAPIIKYAVLENNIVVAIKTTIFSSEIKDNKIITNNDVQVLWRWDGSQFIPPA